MIGHIQVQEMSDTSPTATIGLKNDASIFYTNEAFANLLGYTNAELAGKYIGNYCSENILKSGFLKKFNCEHVYHNEEFELVSATNTTLYLLISSTRSYSDDNSPLIYLFIRNISSYKKNEQLLEYLHHSGEQLSSSHDSKTALESITKVIIPVFADWLAIDTIEDNKIVNLKLEHEDLEFLAWAREFRAGNLNIKNTSSTVVAALTQGKSTLISHITPQMIDEAVPDKETAAIFKKLNLQSSIVVPIIVRENIIGAISFVSSKPGKNYDELDLKFANMFANRVGLTLENVRLLEDAKREIKLRIKAEQKKNEFINVASHELKTPLTSLSASIQLLARMSDKLSAADKMKSLLGKAHISVNKLSKLIDDLLNVSKIERERFKLEKTEFVIAEMLDACCDHVRTDGTHHIKLEGDLTLKVYADRFKIDQVVVNLVNNAVKYSPSSTDIIFNVEKIGSYAKVSIRDFGPGIPDDKVANLFNRYYQVDDNHNKYSGMGLGLYISEKIILRHKGRIGVDTKMGQGSIFWFTLPLSEQ